MKNTKIINEKYKTINENYIEIQSYMYAYVYNIQTCLV